ncbi:MAG: 2,4-dihydroxyhept-2-ene-1,7-dioic acid aldolase [Planctomycetes bacterium]|nr:2,4-dihydroxyhept-2-ene-1,7-dioic acid aldolase [Planctomycetota bacterium]
MRFLQNAIKQKLHNNDVVIGSWLNLPSLEVTEIMARSGFEFLVIDIEHGPADLETIQKMIMVAEGYDCIPIVRVEENNPVCIKKVLDMGCYGVVVPMVNSVEDAQKAIKSTYYPLEGFRGVGLSRAQGYGMEFEKYCQWHRENLVIIAQIEHIDAIHNLQEILSLEGIDASIIGPYDLSASLGFPGDFARKEVKDALTAYERVSKKCGKPYGYHIVQVDDKLFSEKVGKGYTFIAYGVDEIFLAEKCADEIGCIKNLLNEKK